MSGCAMSGSEAGSEAVAGTTTSGASAVTSETAALLNTSMRLWFANQQ